nr:hypothetical protein [Xenorhabdus sp. psl]
MGSSGSGIGISPDTAFDCGCPIALSALLLTSEHGQTIALPDRYDLPVAPFCRVVLKSTPSLAPLGSMMMSFI